MFDIPFFPFVIIEKCIDTARAAEIDYFSNRVFKRLFNRLIE